MEDVLTIEMLLELPAAMKIYSEKFEEYSQLLRAEIYLKYYNVDLRQEILKIINKIQDAKYTFKLGVEDNIDISSHLELNSSKTNTITDKVNASVSRFLDYRIMIKNIYDTLLNVSVKLTKEEMIYLIDSLFCKKSEELICDKLCITRKTLQKIKKSCVVKMAIEFSLIEIELDV